MVCGAGDAGPSAQELGWGDGHWAWTTDQAGRPVREWIARGVRPATAARTGVPVLSVGDYRRPAPSHTPSGTAFIPLCADCTENPAEGSTDLGIRCRPCEHKHKRRLRAAARASD